MLRLEFGLFPGPLLGFAASHKLKITVHPYPLDHADQAQRDLKAGRFDGAAVLIP